MFNIDLIVLGKLKEDYLRAAEEEYTKRLGTYAKLTIIELTEEPFRDPEGELNSIREREATKIRQRIAPGSFVIALDERGGEYTSVDFAHMLEKKSSQGQKLVFVMGGPLGLDRDLLKSADLKLSLSPLTFTHQMARILLLEQLYRAGTILNKKRYHY
ncbi:23S rRNA (pseudouridine(1915)-N(3))-methyltransferase RlmH [Candidatus Peregrinibacteria bacterium CG_4_9_14_0_2_um_filter_53_11]|nr:MAG: 23S rRNA (pseudouridine(1915)-N(3))-methyltransferase RlmH [Candidatus Peregrinibacteria bacterium CG_4_9_14_0_2_um_filter_53_11]